MNHKYGSYQSFFSWGVTAAFLGVIAVNSCPRGKPSLSGFVNRKLHFVTSQSNTIRDCRPVTAHVDNHCTVGEVNGNCYVSHNELANDYRSLAYESVLPVEDQNDVGPNTYPITIRRQTLAMALPTHQSGHGTKMVGGLVNRNNSVVPWRERFYDFWYPVATNIGQKYKDENVLILGGFDHLSPSCVDKMCLEEDGKYAHNNRRSRRKPLAIRAAMEVQTRMGSRLVRTGAIGKANEKAVRSCALSVMTEWKVPRAKQSDVIDYVIELSFITSMRTLRAERIARVEHRTNRSDEDSSRKHRWDPRWWFSNHHNEDEI